MKRHTYRQIQKIFDSLDLDHCLAEGSTIDRGRIKCKCKLCQREWMAKLENLFVGCEWCYPNPGGRNIVYYPGKRIGEWSLIEPVKQKNGRNYWKCKSRKGNIETFSPAIIKYIKANGSPSNDYKRRIRQSCSRKRIEESDWDGFFVDQHDKGRNSLEYKKFRKMILERDKYTCAKCGADGRLDGSLRMEVHHLDNVTDYPDLKFDPNNIVTLCLSCHKLGKNGFHYLFGTFRNTREQYELWISGKAERVEIIPPVSRAVAQIDLDGNIVKIFSSIRSAGRYAAANLVDGLKEGTCISTIGIACREGACRNEIYGYYWKFVSEKSNCDKWVN